MFTGLLTGRQLMLDLAAFVETERVDREC